MHSTTDLKLTDETKVAPIPKKIHYVWVGGPIKKDYLEKIIQAAKLAGESGFELNIWVDDEKNVYKTLQAMNPDSLEIPSSNRVAGIQIRNVNELLPRMQKDDFFKEGDHLKQIQSYINREMTGFKNLAAASDFLRYIILLFEGGYYLDTDMELILKKGVQQILQEEKLPFGFKANLKMGIRGFIGSNDIIASVPQHPIIKDALAISLGHYKELDTTLIGKSWGEILNLPEDKTEMDAKRWPYSEEGNQSVLLHGRVGLTIDKAAGPNSLIKATQKFWDAYSKIEEDLKKRQDMLDSISMSEEWGTVTLGGIAIKEDCHNTWIQTGKKQTKAFDTHTLFRDRCKILNTTKMKKTAPPKKVRKFKE